MNLDQRREGRGGEGRRGRTIFQTTNEAIVDASDYGKKFVGVAHTYVKHLITMQSLRDRASFPLVSKLRFTVSLNNFDLSASRFFVEQRIPPPCISVTSIETLLPELFNCPTYTRHVKTPIARFGQKRKKPPPPSQEGRQMSRPGTRNLPNFQLPAVYFTGCGPRYVNHASTRLIILIQSPSTPKTPKYIKIV